MYKLFGYHETFLSLKEVSHHCWELFISQVPRCKLESTLQAGFSVTRQSQAYYTCSCTEGLPRIYKIKDIAFYSMYGIPCERCIHILISKLIYYIYTNLFHIYLFHIYSIFSDGDTKSLYSKWSICRQLLRPRAENK